MLFVKFFLLQIVNKQQIQTASCFTLYGCDENSNTGLYNNEPEYSKEECKKRKLDSSSDTTDSDDNLDSSRLEVSSLLKNYGVMVFKTKVLSGLNHI